MQSSLSRRRLLSLAPMAGLATLPLMGAPASGKQPRLRSAICAYSFREPLGSKKMSYDDVIHTAVEHGIDGLDLTVYWFPSTDDGFLLPLRRLAYRNAVEIYSISVRSEMTQPTPELRQKEIASVKKWVDVANKLGASHIRVFGGKVPKGSTEDQAAEWVTEVLKGSSDYAGSRGVILGLENHGGITTKADRILQIVKKVDNPWVAVNVDTGNFESDAYRQIEQLIPYAANVQYKIEIRDKGGERAPADWDRLTKMFADHGYRGYLALEYEEKTLDEFNHHLHRLRDLAKKYTAS